MSSGASGIARFCELAAKFGALLVGQGALRLLLRGRRRPGLLQHLAQFFRALRALRSGRRREQGCGEQDEKRLHVHENGHQRSMVHVCPVKRLLSG